MSTPESGSGSMSPTARQTAAMLHSSGGGRRARVLGKQLQELQVWGVWVGGAVSQSCPYQRAGLGGDLNMISNSLLTVNKKANFNFLKIKKNAW